MKTVKSGVFIVVMLLVIGFMLSIGETAEAGILYVAERFNGNVDSIDTTTGDGQVVASGLGGLIGATVDRKGRLFVYRFDARAVALVDPDNHTFVDIATGMGGHGLFSDPNSDTLYLSGFSDGAVYRIREVSSGNWVVDVVAEGLGQPIGSYLIGNRLYISDRANRKLYVTTLGTGVLEEVVDLPDGGEIIDREASGDLIIGTSYQDVYRVNLESKKIVAAYNGFANPAGIIVDPSDNSVLVSEHDGAKITRLNLETNDRNTVTTFVSTPWQSAFKKTISLLTVRVDVKPTTFPNSINPKNNGVIPVAILSTDTFDATTVDLSTVSFGVTGVETTPVNSSFQDVDGDGDTDLMLHFNTQDTGIICGSSSVYLKGKTINGQAIEGIDSVKTVGCK